MANRRDYYFKQKVTEEELDAGFDGLEEADRNLAIDLGYDGINQGLDVVEAVVPNLTVDVTAGVAYSELGERIASISNQNVDVSVDDIGASTDVGTAGQRRIVAVYVEFDRILSDARTDGNGLTVFFQRDETFKFSVVQGPLYPDAGPIVYPPADPTKTLLCDVVRQFGQVQIFNADINTDRRETAIDVVAGLGDPQEIAIQAGNVEDAIQEMADTLFNHVTAVGAGHDATAILKQAGPGWADGTLQAADNIENFVNTMVLDLTSSTGNKGAGKLTMRDLAPWADGTTNVETRLDNSLAKIVTDLTSSTGVRGLGKITAPARGNWRDGTTNPAANADQAVGKIITDLANNGGSKRVGSDGYTTAHVNTPQDSIYNVLDGILTDLEAECGFLDATQTWTGVNTFTGNVDFDGQVRIGTQLIFDNPSAQNADVVSDLNFRGPGRIDFDSSLAEVQFGSGCPVEFDGAANFDGLVNFDGNVDFDAQVDFDTSNIHFNNGGNVDGGAFNINSGAGLFMFDGCTFSSQQTLNFDAGGDSLAIKINKNNANARIEFVTQNSFPTSAIGGALYPGNVPRAWGVVNDGSATGFGCDIVQTPGFGIWTVTFHDDFTSTLGYCITGGGGMTSGLITTEPYDVVFYNISTTGFDFQSLDKNGNGINPDSTDRLSFVVFGVG